MKKGSKKVSQQANELLSQIELLRQPSEKVAKRLWEIDLWQPHLPSPQKAEDCLRALLGLLSLTELVREADTDGKWLAVGTNDSLICLELKSGKIAWRQPLSWQHTFMVANGTVILLISTWDPKLGEFKEAVALDAATGKTLWKQKFAGERIALGKWRDKLAFAQWQFRKEKGKFVFIDPRTGKWESEQPLTWQEFLDWQERFQSRYRWGSPKAFLTDEQGRLVAMRICKKWWKLLDEKVIVALRPDGKLVAYFISP